MRYSRLRISADATSKLRGLKQRTGVTPNLLCRMGLMLSLEEGSAEGIPIPDEDGSEFHRYTLTGEHDSMYVALLQFVEEQDSMTPLSEEELFARLRAHIHRGVSSLGVRVKSATDIARLARVEVPAKRADKL